MKKVTALLIALLVALPAFAQTSNPTTGVITGQTYKFLNGALQVRQGTGVTDATASILFQPSGVSLFSGNTYLALSTDRSEKAMLLGNGIALQRDGTISFSSSDTDASAAAGVLLTGSASTLTLTGGALSLQAGTGTARHKPGGQILRNFASAANVGNTQQVIRSVTIPGGTLSADNQYVRITAWGSFASNANVKTVWLYLNGLAGTALSNSRSTTYNNVTWSFETTIARTGAASGVTRSAFSASTGAAIQDLLLGVPAVTPTWANDNTIDVAGQGVADNDIIVRGITVEVFP